MTKKVLCQYVSSSLRVDPISLVPRPHSLLGMGPGSHMLIQGSKVHFDYGENQDLIMGVTREYTPML